MAWMKVANRLIWPSRKKLKKNLLNFRIQPRTLGRVMRQKRMTPERSFISTAFSRQSFSDVFKRIATLLP